MSREQAMKRAEEQRVPLDVVREYLGVALLTGENVIMLLGVRLPFSEASDLYCELRNAKN